MIAKNNQNFIRGLGNMRIPSVQGGMGGGYNNQSPNVRN